MHHGKCLWRRKGNLWIMLFNHESLLILFFQFSVHTRWSQNNSWINMSLAWVQGLHYYFSLAIRRLQLLWNLLSSSFYLCNINCLPTVINVRQRPLKPIKICFTCGISGWMLGAWWMRHVSADMLNYCLTHVGISYNVQVIALWDLQSDKEGH